MDEFLASQLGWLSRMRIANLLAEGACTVNASAAQAGQRLKPGDVVEITLAADAPLTAMAPEPIPLEILHEDEHILVLVKPAGMLVHPTRGVKSGTLANALAYHLNKTRLEEPFVQNKNAESYASQAEVLSVVRPGLVHRLDRATSGLMVIAKHQRALSILSRHFHHRLVEKRYLALLHGLVAEDEILIDAPIGREAEELPQWGVRSHGRPATTRLRVLERRDGRTLVELEPITGRTNQLRIHCAHLGHPIMGDNWYGADLGQCLCLHASRLAFHHPAGGESMEFNSPLPPEISLHLS